MAGIDWDGSIPKRPDPGKHEASFSPGMAWPDAVFALNDAIALDTLLMAEEMGIRVLGDLVVIGMGISRHASLSTLREPLRELGAVAVEIVLELIETTPC